MNAPIFHPEADRPSQAVLDADAEILARCGAYHVNSLYFASQADASIVRRLTAERLVREQERVARRCVWCSKPIAEGETFMQIAGRNLHDVPCVAEFDEWAYGSASKAEAV